MKHLLRVSTLLLLALFTAGSTWAITMDELFNGASITVGDKLFDSWQLSGYYNSDPTRDFNAGNIDVQPVKSESLDPGPGLYFTVAKDELSVTGDGLYAYIDLMFDFRVTVLDPALQVKDTTLRLTDGDLAWQIDRSNDLGVYGRETIGTAVGQDDLGSLFAEFSVLNDKSIKNSSAQIMFAPQNEIWVRKNFLIWAADKTDTAYLVAFEERFSQTPVPEPSTFILLGAGLVGLVAWRKKHA